MPTVLSRDGVRIVIYTHDHLLPHVHCKVGDGEIIINLDPISIREEYNIKASERRKALRIVEEHQEFLLAEWNRINPVA